VLQSGIPSSRLFAEQHGLPAIDATFAKLALQWLRAILHIAWYRFRRSIG
jgi:hypothetical protein